MKPILFILFSFLLCLTGTPVIRQIAIKKGWLAFPEKDRWHKKPTALLGGIAIYVSIAIPLFIIADFKTFLPDLFGALSLGALPGPSAAIFLGMTFLFILGLIDDFIHLKPQAKLIGQILVASFAAFLGFRLHWFNSLTIDTMVTIFWIIGITNAFNLIDNMDGLCAGTGLVAALFLALIFMGKDPDAFYTALIIGGALAGFLVYNFNPASIFMGDSGSLVIGFSISILTLFYSEVGGNNQISLIAVPLLLLLVPIFDTSLVTVIRLLSGRKASMGGKDHTSHRLVLVGFSEKKAVLLLYGIAGISGLSALFVSRSDSLTSPVVIFPAIISILLMGVYLAQLRVYPEKEFSILRERSFTPILLELTCKRQLMLVILDFSLIAFSYYLAYRLRFDSSEFNFYFKIFLHSLPIIIVCKLSIFFYMGVYRGIWGYISTSDVFLFIKASIVATIVIIAVVTFFYRFKNFSKGIFIIDWFLTTGSILLTRGSFRLFEDTMKRRTLKGQKVVIYGAGRGGELLLREILNNDLIKLNPIGFVDDDQLKTGKKLQGYPVLGTFADLSALNKTMQFSGVIISFNSQDKNGYEAAGKFCKNHGFFLKKFSIDLQDVDLED